MGKIDENKRTNKQGSGENLPPLLDNQGIALASPEPSNKFITEDDKVINIFFEDEEESEDEEQRGDMNGDLLTLDEENSHREIDNNGFLIIRNNPIAKAGVFEYLGSEIGASERERVYKVCRPFKELLKSKDLFKGKPILLEHEWVNPSDNPQIRGAVTGEIRAEEPYLFADLTIYDKETQEAVKSGKYAELSPGYLSDYEEKEGEYDGECYEYVQKNIRFNHLALVEKGRSGHDLRALDKESINKKGDIEMERNEEKQDLETQATDETPDKNALAEEIRAMAMKPIEEFEGGAEEKDKAISAMLKQITSQGGDAKPEEAGEDEEEKAEAPAPAEEKTEAVKDNGEGNTNAAELIEKLVMLLQKGSGSKDAAPAEECGTQTADSYRKSVFASMAKSNKAYEEVKPYTGEFNIYTKDSMLSPKEIYTYGYKCLGGDVRGIKDPETAFKAHIAALKKNSQSKTYDKGSISKDLDSMLAHIK